MKLYAISGDKDATTKLIATDSRMAAMQQFEAECRKAGAASDIRGNKAVLRFLEGTQDKVTWVGLRLQEVQLPKEYK